MLLIIGDGRRKRHGPRYPDMSQGDKKRPLLVRRDDVAQDAAFIAGIIQVRNDAVCLIGVSNIFGLKLFDRRWRQLDFEWHSRL